MLDSIYHIFTNHLWAPFVSLVEELEAKPAGIYVLIVILIVVATTQSKLILKKRLLQNLPNSAVEATNDKKKPKQTKPKPITSNLKFLIITDKVFTLVCLFLVALIIGVCYIRFSPAVSDFLKTDNSSEETPSDTTTTPTTTTTQPTTTTTQPTTTTTTTTYEAPKRLYYYCSCSSCWAEGCPRNGYSYGGYDSYYYTYYHSLCQACSCNSLNAGSFWK